jgi:hypothetical protein
MMTPMAVISAEVGAMTMMTETGEHAVEMEGN